MKRPLSQDEKIPFKSSLRHYHRTETHHHRTWEEWVDGKTTPSWLSQYGWKLLVIVLAVLILGGIIAGLIIELR